MFAHQKWRAFRPASRDVRENARLDETASHRKTAMRNEIGSTNPGAGSSNPLKCEQGYYVAEHLLQSDDTGDRLVHELIEVCGRSSPHSSTIILRNLWRQVDVAMPLHQFDKDRQKGPQTLAAHPDFPRHLGRSEDDCDVATLSDRQKPRASDGSRDRNKLVEEGALFNTARHPVAPRHSSIADFCSLRVASSLPLCFLAIGEQST